MISMDLHRQLLCFRDQPRYGLFDMDPTNVHIGVLILLVLMSGLFRPSHHPKYTPYPKRLSTSKNSALGL